MDFNFLRENNRFNYDFNIMQQEDYSNFLHNSNTNTNEISQESQEKLIIRDKLIVLDINHLLKNPLKKLIRKKSPLKLTKHSPMIPLYKQRKNMARYIIRTGIEKIKKGIYKDFFFKLENMTKENYEKIINYFNEYSDKFINIAYIRKHWMIDEENSKENNLLHGFFLKFCKFFLEIDYPKYVILNGKMSEKNKKEYLKYSRFLFKQTKKPEEFHKNS